MILNLLAVMAVVYLTLLATVFLTPADEFHRESVQGTAISCALLASGALMALFALIVVLG